MMNKIITIPEWRYNKAMENYSELLQELEELERFRGYLGQFKVQMEGLMGQFEMIIKECEGERYGKDDHDPRVEI